jgi:lipopolysaccharide export system ATP-binding protein
MTAPWLGGVTRRDPSLPLTLAAIVRGAGPHGALSLADVLIAYRETFLLCYRDLSRGVEPDLSEDEIRSHLTGSLLPRLASEGWIDDTATIGWEAIQAVGDWWPAASADRAASFDSLVRIARTSLRSPRRAAAQGPRSVLEGDALTKSYRHRRVVDHVSLRLEQGEIVGLLGPNGAGKTTTFYLITGLIRPEEGRVVLDGEDVTSLPMYQRARRGIGYLAQEPSIFRRMTVEDNIRAILEVRGLGHRERERELERVLDELSIRHLRRARAYSLSGGERRRLEITRALVTDPKFMLLDEPFAGVDPIAVHDIQTIVAGLRHRGIGVLITDHNVEQTLDIVDRAYIMFDGKVQAAGTVRDLVFNDRVAQRYLGPTLTTRLRARLEAVA